jgi:hypothetical protein
VVSRPSRPRPTTSRWYVRCFESFEGCRDRSRRTAASHKDAGENEGVPTT